MTAAGTLQVRTPEGVEFSLPLAGPFSRMTTVLLDMAILIAAGGWSWQNGATCFAKAEPEQGLLPADATSRLGYHWGPILSNPAMACVWPELRTNLGPSVRKFIEDSTPETDQAPCQVEL